MAMPSTDSDELAKFGYKQELDRSLGLFSSFAAGFSYISIMTGVFELFFFGFGTGGPAFIWTWPAVFVGQFLVALCFAELAGQYPLAGSVYQWAKQIARPFTAWFGGWVLTVGAIVTLAAVAVAYQVVAPQISSKFQIIGGPADIGLTTTPDGAKNALLRTLIHKRTPEDLRGRAFATYNGARNGAELGALLLGGLFVGLVGARGTMLAAGIGGGLIGLLALLFLSTRSIERRSAAHARIQG